MRTLSPSELLTVWERGLNQPPARWALTLLEAACPDSSSDALARLSIGQRDARLLELREGIFGPQFVSLAACPACGERLELAFSAADIRVAAPGGEEDQGEAEPLSVRLGDEYQVQFRLPNSLDLVAISSVAEAPTASQVLLKRCFLDAQRDGSELDLDQLPAEVIDAVVEKMAEADPQAEVRLSLTCPACGHEWQSAFDIVSFFWSEINTWAHRTMREVHVLASAYGWREADVLAISAWRRQYYLEMASGS
jgi:hypothetical protein